MNYTNDTMILAQRSKISLTNNLTLCETLYCVPEYNKKIVKL